MDRRFHYTPLTTADKEQLYLIVGRRWWAVGKRFLVTAVLPMAIVIPMLFVMNLVILANIDEEKDIKGINIPEGIEDFSLLWFSIPVFIILVLVNLIMFIRSIPPVYIDVKRGKKRQLIFTPTPYTIPGSGKYYINTGLPSQRFIEVSYEQYMAADYTRPCYLEVAPLTNIPLGIKTIEELPPA